MGVRAPKTRPSEPKTERRSAVGRIDAWRRDAGAPFDDLAREVFAQERAKGHSLKASAGVSGISYATATSFERDERMRCRVRELRQGAEAFVGVSVAWVIGELRKNVEGAREENAYKASNEALAMIYKIISEDKSVASSMARALPADVSRGDLQRLLRESFADNARKAAKEPVMIEAEGESVGGGPEEEDEVA